MIRYSKIFGIITYCFCFLFSRIRLDQVLPHIKNSSLDRNIAWLFVHRIFPFCDPGNSFGSSIHQHPFLTTHDFLNAFVLQRTGSLIGALKNISFSYFDEQKFHLNERFLPLHGLFVDCLRGETRTRAAEAEHLGNRETAMVVHYRGTERGKTSFQGEKRMRNSKCVVEILNYDSTHEDGPDSENEVRRPPSESVDSEDIVRSRAEMAENLAFFR